MRTESGNDATARLNMEIPSADVNPKSVADLVQSHLDSLPHAAMLALVNVLSNSEALALLIYTLRRSIVSKGVLDIKSASPADSTSRKSWMEPEIGPSKTFHPPVPSRLTASDDGFRPMTTEEISAFGLGRIAGDEPEV